MIVTQGGLAGGWALYVHEKLTYCYNFFGIDYYVTSAEKEILAAGHQVRMEFAYDGGGSPRAATSPSSTTVSRSGRDGGRTQPVDSPPTRRATSARHRLLTVAGLPTQDVGLYRDDRLGEIDTGDDDHDHLVTAEDRLVDCHGKAVTNRR